MSFSIIIILVVVLFLLAALYMEWFRPTISFFIAIMVLMVSGIITPTEALEGFANEQLAVIVLLLLITDILRQSSVINWLFDRVFAISPTPRRFQFTMIALVSSMSAFFNNTPLVAMMMPYVSRWGKENRIAPSKLLIPLSFAAILGGCITLIGTSTNLIVNGMAEEAGFEPLGIFDFTLVGLPMLVIGGIYLLFFGNRLLPDHKNYLDEFVEQSRSYFVEAEIKPNSELIGTTVEEGGLRNLKGIYLIEVLRGEKKFGPLAPNFILEEGDILIFTGDTTLIEEISRKELGLTLPKACEFLSTNRRAINEVVISFNSTLIGKKVKESDFRARFDAAIVAVHRNGEKLSGKIGEVVLKAGDVLLIFSGSDFASRSRSNQAFYILSHNEEPPTHALTKVWVSVSSLIVAILLAAFTPVSLFIALAAVFLLALLLKIVPLVEVRRSLDMDLILLIAFGLALGKAMSNSGAAAYLAEGLLLFDQHLGPFGFMVLIFAITNILAAYITNKAAVAIIFPISVAIAMEMGVDPTPFILIVAFGAAANFITPIGYQTNLMVYGPGGYSFKDFMKVGLPLSLIYMFVSAALLAYYYQLF